MKENGQHNRSKNTLPSWDLSDLYFGIEDINLTNDLKLLQKDAMAFAKAYTNNLSQLAAHEMYEAVIKFEKMYDLIAKISAFAYLMHTTNLDNSSIAIFYQNMAEKLSDINTQLIFFTLQINNLDDQHLEQLIADSEELSRFKQWFMDLRSFKKYQLSDKEELILSQTAITGNQLWQRLFDEKIDDLQFNFAGQQISCSEILNKLSSINPEERKEAAKELGRVFGNNIKLFTLITNTLAKDKNIIDGFRGFPSPISSRNIANLIEDDVVTSLINSVKKSYPNLSHRYYKLKAKWFGKDALEYWDRNAPIPDSIDTTYSWQEAVDIVLSAYDSFSPELRVLAEPFFENDWIDAAPKFGKRTGAFAHPASTDTHPYLMLNYYGKARDVMTLAHELGHGVHQILSKKQGALLADTPLTLAETASVFAEQLVFRDLLSKEKNLLKRKSLIASKVEDMLNTVVRQIAFCCFEEKLHEGRKNGELSIEQISTFWLDTQKESFGNSIVLHDEYKNFWAYVPHFIHSPFYVYSYAFGDCLVNSLYQLYLDGFPNFQKAYFDLLSAGGSKRYSQLLKPFGFSKINDEFWHKGLSMISGFIDELETFK